MPKIGFLFLGFILESAGSSLSTFEKRKKRGRQQDRDSASAPPLPKICFSFLGFILESAGSSPSTFEKRKKEADSKTAILILGISKG